MSERLTARQAADYLGSRYGIRISVSTMRRWAAQRHITMTEVGLDAFVARRTRGEA
jgi:hypothetical protein